MRGKGFFNFNYVFITRITPAYAGKRQKKRKNFLENWDHPRLCGEKFAVSAFVRDFRGSPPPMRGKVRNCVRGVGGCGDHPRLCGEKNE